MCQIGSSPGFEDGAFESAKLVRPAASFYHAVDDCLYFVDSEVYFGTYWIANCDDRFCIKTLEFDIF